MFPKEMWTEAPLLDLEGSQYIRLENYQSILEFTDEKLKLRMKKVIYEVQGKRLIIRGVTRREIFLEGEIESLRIIREENR